LSYNASVVKIYSATNSMARFYNKIIFLLFKNALAHYYAGVVAVNSKVAGLTPGSQEWLQDRGSGSRIAGVAPGSREWLQDRRIDSRIAGVAPGSQEWLQDRRSGSRIEGLAPGSQD
jgi:hypothetical protein